MTASHKKMTQFCIMEVSLNSVIEASMITTYTALTPSSPASIGILLFLAFVMQVRNKSFS